MTRSSVDTRALIRSWSVCLMVQTTCCLPATRICIHCLSHLQFAQWRAGLIAFEWFDVDWEICVCERKKERTSEKSSLLLCLTLVGSQPCCGSFGLEQHEPCVSKHPNTRSCPLILTYKRSHCNATVVGYTCKCMQIYNGSLMLTNLSNLMLTTTAFILCKIQ